MKILVQALGWFFCLIGLIFAGWIYIVANASHSWSAIGGPVLMAKSLNIFWCTAGVFVCLCMVLALVRAGSRKEMMKAGLLAIAGAVAAFLILTLKQTS